MGRNYTRAFGKLLSVILLQSCTEEVLSFGLVQLQSVGVWPCIPIHQHLRFTMPSSALTTETNN